MYAYVNVELSNITIMHKYIRLRYIFVRLYFFSLFYAIFRYNCVEMALTNHSFVQIEHLDGIVEEFGEVACFALQLIAKLCSVTERHEIAAEANRRALKLNPFLWQPFAELCNYGHKVNPNEVYKFDNVETFSTCQENFGLNGSYIVLGSNESNDGSMSESDVDSNKSYNIYTTPIMDQQPPIIRNMMSPTEKYITNPLNTSTATSITNLTGNENTADHGNAGATPFRKQFRYLSNFSPTTPSFGWLKSPTEYSAKSKSASPTQQQMLSETNEQNKNNCKKLRSNVANMTNRKEAPLQISKPVFNQTGNTTPRAQNPNSGQNVRRSSRLFTNNSVKENSKNPLINKFALPQTPPRKNKPRLTSKTNLASTALNEINSEKPQKQISDLDKEKIETITSATHNVNTKSYNNSQNITQHILNMRKQSAEGLMSLLRSLAEGYQQLSVYDCKEAIQTFQSIPKHHFSSCWVQSMIAKAYHEQREYEVAAKIFQDVHRKEPYRMQLMEIYSTVLWHLQREVHLSALAQDLMAQDRLSPITWCVAGNCFSLMKEHETAIKFFERAVQVDPLFAYSYTLLGHELVITEELDKAMSCFRTAILKDPRHYNAWFGIGSIYSKQERYSLAEFHYKHALEINPKSSVILVHIGVMQFNLKKTEQAMQTMNAAIELDPKNPLCKFHRGSMYFQCGEYSEALKELEQLKQIVPKESVVFYIIGKIHKKLGNVDLALMNFSWATDLDPKGANNQVKDAFDPNSNQTNIALNVTQDATEPPSEQSDDSTQLRSGDNAEVDAEAEGYLSDSF